MLNRIRVVKKTSESGIPSVVVTAHHATGQAFAPLALDYMKDLGYLKGGIYHDIEGRNPKSADLFIAFKSINDKELRTSRVPETWSYVFKRLHDKTLK